MPTMFTAPLETLTTADVDALLGWPESLTAEFKRELPGRDGRPDGWTTGGKVEEYARTRLFKEIVALANTAGGHLLIGMDEDKTASPPTACGIIPVPRCAELAERLIQMAQSIDPPIPFLVAKGIPTEGEAGVVLVRVPASRSAPHRSTDREIYVRRGTNSVPVSMREVREMVLSAGRSEAAIQAVFETAARTYREWAAIRIPEMGAGVTAVPAAAFRITAIPVGCSFELSRLFGRIDHNRFVKSFTLNLGSEVVAPHKPLVTRPILRGIEMRFMDNHNTSYVSVHTNGAVTAAFRAVPPTQSDKAQLYLGHVLAYMLNILRLANFCRSDAGTPECEYAIEVELTCVGGNALSLNLWGSYDDQVGVIPMSAIPLVFPRLSYGPAGDADAVISRFADDVTDAATGYRLEPWDLRVVKK